MGILRSFNVGVSGLTASGQSMGVIADNIANAGTNGFKASRSEFQDVLATSLKGIDGGDQFGAGTRLAHIKPVMTQGDVARTDSITDIAINGDGFFNIKAPFGNTYTRDGSFHFNKEGELVNSDEYPVIGYEAGTNGKISNKMGPIKIGNTAIPAEGTTELKLTVNLDSRDDIIPFNPEDPENTSQFAHSVTVYDNIGTQRLVTIFYEKTGLNQFKYHAMVDGSEAEGGIDGKFSEMATGTVKFNDKGILQEEIEEMNAFNFNKGAAQGQQIKFNFGESVTEGGDGMNASTQYGTKSNVARHTQDGFQAGTLASMSFNDDGILTAAYDNGISKSISQIAVAKFENNEGLFKIGKNLFKASRKSGQVANGKPGSFGRGEVLSKSLELSNVDIANEFVNLMKGQRNFSANAKTLTTADQMLQDVLAIKR